MYIELITELLNLHAVTVFLLGCHVLEGMCAVDGWVIQDVKSRKCLECV